MIRSVIKGIKIHVLLIQILHNKLKIINLKNIYKTLKVYPNKDNKFMKHTMIVYYTRNICSDILTFIP